MKLPCSGGLVVEVRTARFETFDTRQMHVKLPNFTDLLVVRTDLKNSKNRDSYKTEIHIKQRFI